MARLAVNVDHVATVRQARGIDEPDPVLAAGMAELAGAEGIICHLREDRRHINERDLSLLRQTVKTRLNMEMAAVNEIVDIALSVKPDLVTLVPEKRQELTTEGGLDVKAEPDRYKKVVDIMKKANISVSFFVDPEIDQIKASHECGADIVEIHTGHYADAKSDDEATIQFKRIEDATKAAADLGLKVSAGHGLGYTNIKRFKAIPLISEYSIGHSIVARAVIVGFEKAVRDMLNMVKDF